MPTATPDRRAQQASRRRHPTARPRPGRGPRRGSAPPLFYALLVVCLVLPAFGLVMVLSASSVVALHTDGSSWVYFQKQAMYAVLGGVALLVGAKVHYQWWRRFVVPLLALTVAMLVAVLVVGRRVNGARAWLAVGPLTVQPSELAKLVLLLYAAHLYDKRSERMNRVGETFAPVVAVLGVICVLVLLQPDFGSMLVLVAVVLAVSFLAGVPLVPFATFALGGAALATGFIMTQRRGRWLAFMDLAKYKGNEGFQVWQSLVGIASGGVTGVGIGASKAKWGYLPEAHTDFIFAIVAEELGLLGVIALCGLFLSFGVFGVQAARRAPDRFGMLVAGGITAWIVTQAVVNIGGVTGIMPLTGLTLPFVSFGGTSLVVTMGAAGLLLNVARQGRWPR
jgi:cell division protein FtsW